MKVHQFWSFWSILGDASRVGDQHLTVYLGCNAVFKLKKKIPVLKKIIEEQKLKFIKT